MGGVAFEEEGWRREVVESGKDDTRGLARNPASGIMLGTVIGRSARR
jgi:hypothetical protein